ncbi:type II secretion system major pseudopilin GspG [Echinimonas agarilytica]|uniref:Type II secretion system core protein G n=1 Tax=Echinimonas agarilytica TaxID=1215918 RepID=A0AA42B956_9GAMM|nr:type II secretion system major pseudopilin GspG [Echinimonas agarilytica]MCM2680891.1 type II secretion system major pseudopilin GspG [Echinimonas agarilytica]
MNNKPQRQSGFTLLEVMVVIVILGVMASMVVPRLLESTGKAQTQKAVSDIAKLEEILDMYKLDNHRYPTTEQGLEALVERPTSSPEPRNYPEEGYLRRLEVDPWGNPYLYESPGTNGKVDIYTLGADGEEGGEDADADIGNWNLQDFR